MSLDLQNLTETQVRRVLEVLNASRPDLVNSAVSQVLDQDSVATAPVSNTAPLRRPDIDDGEELPPPLVVASRQRDASRGGRQPLPVSHASVRR